MNNFPYPYMQYPNIGQFNIENEIQLLKYEIKILKEKVQNLENKNHKNYLKKEEGKYIM